MNRHLLLHLCAGPFVIGAFLATVLYYVALFFLYLLLVTLVKLSYALLYMFASTILGAVAPSHCPHILESIIKSNVFVINYITDYLT